MVEDTEENDPLFTSITRKTLLIFINFLIMGLIGLISWKVVSTNIPQESIGIVQFSFGFIGMFSFIMNIGIGSSHVKRISEGKDLGRCMGTFLTLKVILTAVFAACVVGSIFIWKNVVGKGFETLHHEPVLYLMLLYFISNNLATIGARTFVGRVEIAKYQSTILVAAVIQLIATIIVALMFNDPYWLAITYIIGAFVNFSFSFILLSRFPIKAPTFKMMKSYFVFALPIFIVSVLSTLPPNIDKVFIQLFYDASAVAIYRGGQVYSQYIMQISAGLGMILFPVFSSLKAKGKDSEITDVVFRSERLIAIIICPIAAMLFALAIPVVTILGDSDYRASYLVLQFLVLWAFLKALISPYRNLIMGVGKPKVLALISVVSVSTIILLDLIFIPTDIKILNLKLFGLGASGAALATYLSALITFIMMRIFAYKYERVLINPRIVKALLMAVMSGVVIYILNYYIPATNIVMLSVYTAGGFFLYFIFMLVFKGFEGNDKDLLMKAIDVRLMLKYLKEEFFGRQRNDR